MLLISADLQTGLTPNAPEMGPKNRKSTVYAPLASAATQLWMTVSSPWTGQAPELARPIHGLAPGSRTGGSLRSISARDDSSQGGSLSDAPS
jgi:hypothetical protein